MSALWILSSEPHLIQTEHVDAKDVLTRAQRRFFGGIVG